MPILDIEVVGEVAASERDSLARNIAEGAGKALHSRPQDTWVKLHFIPSAAYAENAGGPPDGVQPVFVRALLGMVPEGDALADLAFQLSAAVAHACQRPVAHVHIIFEPAGLSRVAFGGKLARAKE